MISRSRCWQSFRTKAVALIEALIGIERAEAGRSEGDRDQKEEAHPRSEVDQKVKRKAGLGVERRADLKAKRSGGASQRARRRRVVAPLPAAAPKASQRRSQRKTPNPSSRYAMRSLASWKMVEPVQIYEVHPRAYPSIR